MSWNYRVIRRVYKRSLRGVEVEEVTFSIHEVYYERDLPVSVSVEGTTTVGETLEELADDIKRMTEALAKPVLAYEGFGAKTYDGPFVEEKMK